MGTERERDVGRTKAGRRLDVGGTLTKRDGILTVRCRAVAGRWRDVGGTLTEC